MSRIPTMRRRLAAPTIPGALALMVGLAGTLSCNPQKGSFGLEAIRTLATPPDDPNLKCGLSLPADQLASQRSSCAFKQGAFAADTLGIDKSAGASIPIRHVIVMMKENRSFDHLLGKLHERGQFGVEAIPATYTNPDARGNPVSFSHATTTCLTTDPDHQSAAMARCVDGGKMDGFVQNAAQSTGTDGHFAMSYYDNTDLPFYYWLASTFAISDRHFAPMVSGTYGNRAYYIMGDNAGSVDTGIVFPPPNTPSIMQLLQNSGHTWGVYTDDAPFSGTLDWTSKDPGVHTLDEFNAALDNGTLPNVAFVDGIQNIEDDHPTADLQRGEAWLKKFYDHAVKSPQWERLAIIWTYDEAGAFADHVPPDTGCPASDAFPSTQRGPRIPLVMISPWAKRNYVSHLAHDHTAITRFIELLFDLPALTARDANSDGLLDLFDFSCHDLRVAAAPDPGTGSCTNKAVLQ